MAIRRLSAAAISRYRRCPRQFSFVDVERVPRDERPSPQLAVANAVHHSLERFFGVEPAKRTPQLLETALRSVWPQHRERETFADREDERRHGLEALRMLHGFGEWSDLGAVPLAREQWLSARTSNGVELFGKLDRIDQCASGSLEVVDYKTGRHMIEDVDLPREPAVQVYVTLAESAYCRPVERIRFLYLAHGCEVGWSPEREDIEAVKAELAAVVSEIRVADDFPAWPGEHCRFCPAVLFCPERQRVAVEELVPVEDLPF
jgi:RecB family exonuclease